MSNLKIKRCTRCGETKTRDEFPFNRHALDKMASWCKECMNAEGRRRRAYAKMRHEVFGK